VGLWPCDLEELITLPWSQGGCGVKVRNYIFEGIIIVAYS